MFIQPVSGVVHRNCLLQPGPGPRKGQGSGYEVVCGSMFHVADAAAIMCLPACSEVLRGRQLGHGAQLLR